MELYSYAIFSTSRLCLVRDWFRQFARKILLNNDRTEDQVKLNIIWPIEQSVNHVGLLVNGVAEWKHFDFLYFVFRLICDF